MRTNCSFGVGSSYYCELSYRISTKTASKSQVNGVHTQDFEHNLYRYYGNDIETEYNQMIINSTPPAHEINNFPICAVF